MNWMVERPLLGKEQWHFQEYRLLFYHSRFGDPIVSVQNAKLVIKKNDGQLRYEQDS